METREMVIKGPNRSKTFTVALEPSYQTMDWVRSKTMKMSQLQQRLKDDVEAGKTATFDPEDKYLNEDTMFMRELACRMSREPTKLTMEFLASDDASIEDWLFVTAICTEILQLLQEASAGRAEATRKKSAPS